MLTGKETWMAGELWVHLRSLVPLASAIPPAHQASTRGEPELVCAAPQKRLLPSAGQGSATSEPRWSRLSASDRGHDFTALRCFLFKYYYFYFNSCSVQREKKRTTFLVNKIEHLKKLIPSTSPFNWGCVFDRWWSCKRQHYFKNTVSNRAQNLTYYLGIQMAIGHIKTGGKGSL